MFPTTSITTNSSRFFDSNRESQENRLVIEGYEHCPLVTLEKAVEFVLFLFSPSVALAEKAKLAKQRSKGDVHVTLDQAAAIQLYTFGWEPAESSLYYLMNDRLRSKNRDQLKVWFHFLKLLLSGLWKLPSFQGTVYRGIKGPLLNEDEYRQGETFTWWGFTSATSIVEILNQETFLGNTGPRTWFIIDCFNGKNIQDYSYFHEAEVLLLPGSQFKVISKLKPAPDLNVIQIKQMEPDVVLLRSPFQNSSSSSASASAVQSATASASLLRDRGRHQNADGFLLIWLDQADSSSAERKQLRRIMNRLMAFGDAEECVDFLTAHDDETIFLIVSGFLGQKTVPDIHTLPQVDSIYVYCQDKAKHEQWSRPYDKVRGVFIDIRDVCAQLEEDKAACLEKELDRIILQDSVRRPKLDLSFIHFLILKKILLSMESTEEAKNELIHTCRQIFEGNESELRRIADFEKRYRPDKAVWWYTCASFLYRTVRDALRVVDINLLFSLRFYIKDLHKQLSELHEKHVHGSTGRLALFRAQSLPIEAFEKIVGNVGGFFTANQYLSTCSKLDFSLQFASGGSKHSELVSTVLEFDIDLMECKSVFAEISRCSAFPQEDEFLLDMGSFSRVRSVKKLQDGIWYVRLHLIGEEDEEVRAIMKASEREYLGGNPLIGLAKLCTEMGQTQLAEKFYLLAIENT